MRKLKVLFTKLPYKHIYEVVQILFKFVLILFGRDYAGQPWISTKGRVALKNKLTFTMPHMMRAPGSLGERNQYKIVIEIPELEDEIYLDVSKKTWDALSIDTQIPIRYRVSKADSWDRKYEIQWDKISFETRIVIRD